MEDFFKGKQGQYFTPREVVNFVIQLCDINNNSKILDPACGSGGFLLHVLDFVRNLAGEYYDEDSAEYFKFWHDFAANNLFGIEVNERIARVAKMNMIIHDDGHTNVICSDALERFNKIQSINQKFQQNSFDLILTNPPFGATIKKEEKTYLNDFIFGRKENGEIRKTQKTEILFIERCWQFLKEGTGRLAIVLPDGILTNKTLKYVRNFIQDKFEIEGTFSLHQVTFVHYGAGLKSTILVLRKISESEKRKDNDVFCALIDRVGYDRTGRKDKNEFPKVVDKFNEFKSGKVFNTHSIFVKKVNQLNNNRLDAYYYSPMFEDIIEKIKTSKYPLKRLKDICSKVKIGDKESIGIFNGATPAKDNYSENINDPKIVKVASLKTGKVNLNRVENVNPDFVSQKTIKDGDILILSSAHQAEYLGRNPCIVNITEELKNEEINFVGELINIRVNNGLVNPYYLLQLFNTRNYYLLINREKRGQTSHLYPSDMENILIPVPDNIDIQNNNATEYIKSYDRYERLINDADETLQKSYSNFEKQFLK